VQRVKAFFEDIDGRWKGPAGETIELRLIGSTALMVLTDYDRGTKDSDVVETPAIRGSTRNRLVELAGPNTALQQRHRIYLDLVQSGLLFLPHVPIYQQPAELNAELRHFRIAVLDVVDVVVSKLLPFRQSDQEDINEMIQRGKVLHSTLIERFRAAVDSFSCDARADDLHKYVSNLHRIERDAFGVSETEIDLPGWVAD
jgi:hypothetical protein